MWDNWSPVSAGDASETSASDASETSLDADLANEWKPPMGPLSFFIKMRKTKFLKGSIGTFHEYLFDHLPAEHHVYVDLLTQVWIRWNNKSDENTRREYVSKVERIVRMYIPGSVPRSDRKYKALGGSFGIRRSGGQGRGQGRGRT